MLTDIAFENSGKVSRFFHFALWLLLILYVQSGFAQTEKQTIFPAVFSHLTVNDGLSSNTVSSIIQDKYGYIWIGTNRGVNRYDGHLCQQLNRGQIINVTSMCEQGDTIWIGTDHGLYLCSQIDGSILLFEPSSSVGIAKDYYVTGIAADSQGDLWVSTMDNGVYRLKKSSKEYQSVAMPKKGMRCGCVCIDKYNNVWTLSNEIDNSIMRFDRKKNRFDILRPKQTSANSFDFSGTTLCQSHDGTLLLGSWDGEVARLNTTTNEFRILIPATKSGLKHIHSIVELHPGYILVGSDTGLYFYDVKHDTGTLYTRNEFSANAISDNFIYPIFCDKEGGVWIGTYYGGVNYTHPVAGNFTSHVHSRLFNSVSGNVVSRFCEDANGDIWVASDDGGLSLYHPATDTFQQIPLSPSGAAPNVHALCMYGNKLLVGTYAQGMSIVDVGTHAVTHIPYFLDDKGEAIDVSSYAMYVDKKSRVWVGTFNSVCTFNPQTQRFQKQKEIGCPVLAIHQDKTGRLWFASDGSGLWSYNDKSKKWKQYTDFGESLSSAGQSISVTDIQEDSQGVIWVATSNGLFHYNPHDDSFSCTRVSSEPLSVLSLAVDGDDMWLTTTNGLRRYSLSQHKLKQVVKTGGNLSSTDFMPAAMLRSSKGVIYLGTTSGFYSFSPRLMHHNDVVPKVMFSELEIFNKPVAVGSTLLPQGLNTIGELRLSYRETVIRLFYSAMSFIQPSDNSYSYYMEGFDSEWINAGNDNSVTYTNLAPGTYTLHVRATNNDGVESDDATLRIVITPPFYWNTPAQILYLLIILALIYYVVRRIINKQKKQHVAEIKEINTQKEQEIQEINSQKENAIKEISIQKEQEIQEINTQKEQEVHDARIKFMTITPKDQEFLDKMESVIEHNIANTNLSVEFLATELGVSRTGLFTKLKSLADVTPNEMIQVIRLKHAASLLLTNQYRVNEVCYMVGFSSPSYFAKCFQKQYGTTPAKFMANK